MLEPSDHARYQRELRAWCKNAAANDPDALADMMMLASWFQSIGMETIVRGLREQGYSWSQIAAPIGFTRSAAYQRWSTVSDQARATGPR